MRRDAYHHSSREAHLHMDYRPGSTLTRLLARLESSLDLLRRRARRHRKGHRPLRIISYRGHGTARRLHLKGRVLEGRPIPPATATDSRWKNILHVLRRIESDELPDVLVRARVGEQEWSARSDEEGYFRFELDLTHSLDGGRRWYPVELELGGDVGDGAGDVRATGHVLVPPSTARFGVISDIDDTVIETGATNLLRMIRIVLLTNAHTRLPFEGAAAFYRALQQGVDGDEGNPIFYVSSSPWNFYGLLEEIFTVHEIPAGPLFLKDYGLTSEVLFATGHEEHKLEAIRTLLRTHPELRWVLIGDSGQKDPEIYRSIVRDHPDRIAVIYIRDVATTERDREIGVIAEETRRMGVEMVLVADTAEAARDAVRRGLISPNALPEIRAVKAKDEAAPSPLESIAPG